MLCWCVVNRIVKTAQPVIVVINKVDLLQSLKPKVDKEVVETTIPASALILNKGRRMKSGSSEELSSPMLPLEELKTLWASRIPNAGIQYFLIALIPWGLY